MSISASIDLKLYIKNNHKVSASDIIKNMIENGWRIENNRKICYLPIGDDDSYDWQEKELGEDAIFEIINQKENSNEIIGLNLYWKDSDIGVIMLIFADFEISFSTSINRLKINSLKKDVTDVSWYLQRIIPCFDNEKMSLLQFSFNQDYCG